MESGGLLPSGASSLTPKVKSRQSLSRDRLVVQRPVVSMSHYLVPQTIYNYKKDNSLDHRPDHALPDSCERSVVAPDKIAHKSGMSPSSRTKLVCLEIDPIC